MTSPDNDRYAPSVFIMDYQGLPQPGQQVIPPMPRSPGGVIESVKTSLLEATSDALSGMTLFDRDTKLFISLDYPLEQEQYPGVWVQFSITKLNRVGLGHEVPYQDPETHEWSFIQEWMFEARATFTIAALKSRTRDRIADALMMMIAFARTPQLSITRTQADTKQNRSLITALDENPYVALTLNTDTIIPSGEQASMGTPWANDKLTYENGWSIDMVGQFNLAFTHDGLYTLSKIEPNFQISDVVQPYQDSGFLDSAARQPYGGGIYPTGSQNPGNVDFPGL